MSDATADVAVEVEAGCAPPCPLDAPTPGKPCTSPNQTCEYRAPEASCGAAFASVSGTWSAGSSLMASCASSDAAACGPSLTATEGTACALDTRCDFDGAICSCSFGKFDCEHATNGCLLPRPLVGSSCASNGTVCTNYLDLACTPQIACRACEWRAEYVHTCP